MLLSQVLTSREPHVNSGSERELFGQSTQIRKMNCVRRIQTLLNWLVHEIHSIEDNFRALVMSRSVTVRNALKANSANAHLLFFTTSDRILTKISDQKS